MRGRIAGDPADKWQPIRIFMVFSDLVAAASVAGQLRVLTDQPQWVSEVTGPVQAAPDSLPSNFDR